MNQHKQAVDNYEIVLSDPPLLTDLKAKYNACANKLNRNKRNPGFLSEAEVEELSAKLHVIQQLISAHIS